MFNWLGSPKGLKPNRKRQPRCSNFERLEAIIRKARHGRRKTTDFTKLHPSYGELENCARNGCVGCRVIRQGLLLAQISGRQIENIERRDAPVYARWCNEQESSAAVPSQPLLQVTLGVQQLDTVSVDIALTTNIDRPMLSEKRFNLIFPQIRNWLDNCCIKHEARCGNLSWSKENPRRLIEVISDSKLKLIDASDISKLDYIALSYCWGVAGTHGNTTWDNLSSRQVGFSTQDLPETIQDAALLVRRLDLRYVWVDQVCIVQPTATAQGEDWDLEGSRMHVVYGNALFTLTACSSETSTDGLFRPRKAWTYPVKPFYLEGQWLVNFDVTLKEVRARAPLSSRAWVLQEERLSPRLLYFCSQRFYWSCAMAQHREVGADSDVRNASVELAFAREGDHELMSEPQAFLDVRSEGDKYKLHNEWQDLVEAYCLRNMTKSSDRFRALSGLAAQYLRVYLNKDNKFVGQHYLAGLWQATFAEDLAWSVSTATHPHLSLIELAPSWSWASLPLSTRINTKKPFSPVEDFVLMAESEPSMQADPSEVDSGLIVLEACRKGAGTKRVTVRGRLQRVMNDSFRCVDWSEIQVKQGSSNGYSFAKYIDQHVYARDLSGGRIVIHEPTKRSMEGQLDYLAPLDDGTVTCRDSHVAADTERDLHGLQIGQKTMLLLKIKPPSDRAESQDLVGNERHKRPLYYRVGVCTNVRDAFFDGIEASEINLC